MRLGSGEPLFGAIALEPLHEGVQLHQAVSDPRQRRLGRRQLLLERRHNVLRRRPLAHRRRLAGPLGTAYLQCHAHT